MPVALAPLPATGQLLAASVPISASNITGSAPVALVAGVQAALGGGIIAGNIGISIPPAALAGQQGQLTISISPHPANVPIPGGPAQYSPNGTLADVVVTDQNGNQVTTFPAPITLTFKYNAADVGQASGNASILSAAYVIDANSPAIENPLQFPVGTFVFFPPSNTALDTTGGTITVTTQALGSVVAVVTNPVGYVQTLDQDTPVYSSFDPGTSQEFGTRPQFSFLQVVEPQIGTRLLVLDPDTGNYSYVDAASVGPSGPPQGQVPTAVVRGLLSPDVGLVPLPAPTAMAAASAPGPVTQGSAPPAVDPMVAAQQGSCVATGPNVAADPLVARLAAATGCGSP